MIQLKIKEKTEDLLFIEFKYGDLRFYSTLGFNFYCEEILSIKYEKDIKSISWKVYRWDWRPDDVNNGKIASNGEIEVQNDQIQEIQLKGLHFYFMMLIPNHKKRKVENLSEFIYYVENSHFENGSEIPKFDEIFGSEQDPKEISHYTRSSILDIGREIEEEKENVPSQCPSSISKGKDERHLPLFKQ